MADANPFVGHELRSPTFSVAEAAALARERFGVEGALTELGSHQDQNFLIETDGPPVVLKIANPAFSFAELDLQNSAMRHLQAAGLPFEVPIPLPALDGTEIVEVDRDGRTYRARLVTFIEGETLERAGYLAPPILRELGELAARAAGALSTFDHPAADRMLEWDLRQARAVVDALGPLVADPGRRDLARRIMDEAGAALETLEADLRVQVIHGDVTDYTPLGAATGPAACVRAG